MLVLSFLNQVKATWPASHFDFFINKLCLVVVLEAALVSQVRFPSLFFLHSLLKSDNQNHIHGNNSGHYRYHLGLSYRCIPKHNYCTSLLLKKYPKNELSGPLCLA